MVEAEGNLRTALSAQREPAHAPSAGLPSDRRSLPGRDRYGPATSGFVYGTAPSTFIEREVRRLPQGASVLALGAGEGRNAVFLAQQGFDVTAIDYSGAGLAKTHRLDEERGVSVQPVQADVAIWSPSRRA